MLIDSWNFYFFSSCFLSDYPWRQRTLDNCGQEGSVPFVPDGREDHLLSLIVNRNVQEGGLLLVQDHLGIVAQQQADGFGVALPRRKVKCGVLSEKTTQAIQWQRLLILWLFYSFVSLLNCLRYY